MKNDIFEYLLVLQQIVECRNADFENMQTPYALETKRCELHRKLLETHVFLFLEDGADYNLAYERSKNIFNNLDKVWHIYNDYSLPFDIKDNEVLRELSKKLTSFLLKTETLYYLEGKTAHIHGLDIDIY